VTTTVSDSATQVAGQAREPSKRVADAAVEITSAAADRAVVATSGAAHTVSDRAGEIAGGMLDQLDNGLPINSYDELTAAEITAKLGSLSQADLAKIDAYERRNANRSTVTDRISSLRGDEPWPGYDEQTVFEIRETLSADDKTLARTVYDYERRHKNRHGVLDAVGAASM
jgi:hypothetical protein